MRMMKNWRGLFVCLGLAALLPACGGATLMSEADEAKIGAEQHPQIIREYGGVYDDPKVTAYVERIVSKLGKVSDKPDMEYRITVLDSPVVNAFALPGGYTYVTRGLLALADNEAEMAGVIGHEIAHVTARHGAKRHTASVGTAIAAGVAGIFLNVTTGIDARAAGDVLSVGGGVLLAGYSRENEYEADNLGIKAMARAGYQPQAQADLLQSLADFARYQSGGKAVKAGWFSSHPNSKERVAKARKKARAAMLKINGAPEVGRFAHLAAIDGIVYGDGPKQGVIRGQEFSHAALAMRFSVPRGFSMENSPARVVATHKNRVQIVFDMDERVALEPAADYLQGGWAANNTLSDFRSLKIGGRDAALGTMKTDNGIAVLLAIVENEEQFLRFGVLAPAGQESAARAAMAHMTRKIQFLSKAEAAAIRPHRIKIMTVEKGDTVYGLSRRMGGPNADKQKLFRLLNNLGPEDGLSVGQRVKLISG